MSTQKARKIVVKGNPSWLPGPLWNRKERVAVKFRFSKPERKIYRKRKKIPVSDWAERHRYVATGPYEGTKFKKKTFAYAPAIMDASFHPSVQEIVLCAADQASKSFIIDTCVGYSADRAPGPVLFVYPDEDTTKDNMRDRLVPMFRMSPRLKSYLTGSVDDEGQKRINLQHMAIYAAWATSASKLANKPIKYGIADEVDKFPLTAGKKEGTPLDKIRKRLRLYRFGRKLWISSTPTIESGPVWAELNLCDVVFEYRVCCPDCGEMQLMEFETDKRLFRWPEEVRDPEKIEKDDLGYYICKHCGTVWGDFKRDVAVRWGKWFAMEKTPDNKREIQGSGVELFEYLKKYNPRKIGFHIPSWISPAVGISEVCAAFLRGQKDKNKLKDFNNSHRAWPWTDWTEERKEDRILELKDDRPRGMVPGRGVVSCLTAGVDTQGSDETGGFWYEIGAWGWPSADLELDFWQIKAGYIGGFASLKEILFKDVYRDADGNKYHVALAIQDAMGRRTDEVYKFAKMNPGRVIPSQGVDTRRMTQPHTWSNIETFPGSKKRIAGGLQLLRFDATHYKNILASKFEINPEDPGAWHLNSETTEEWARHMCSEFVNDKGLWELIGSRANHGWDCSVLNILAAEVLRVKFWQRPGEKTAQQNINTDRVEKSGWIPRKNTSWLERR